VKGGIGFVLVPVVKHLTWIVLAMLPAACAAPGQNAPINSSASSTLTQTHVYAPASAGALAFDPPVLEGQERIDLSREDRRPSAFVSYDDTITTFSYTRTDDQQVIMNDNDRYDRRALSEKYGTSYR
jgi:hypothetical protein